MSVESPERVKAWRTRRHAVRRAAVIALKANPCLDCGGRFAPECMDFDHVRGKKAQDISRMVRGSVRALVNELEKCELVCANCHRIRTFRP